MCSVKNYPAKKDAGLLFYHKTSNSNYMSNAITISGSTYTVTGTIKDQANGQGVQDVLVSAYDKDRLSKDDFLGIAPTNAEGVFSISFDATQFRNILDKNPDLYFIVEDGGFQLLDTKNQTIEGADESTPPIVLEVDLTDDKMRKLINPEAVPGWVGGFAQSNPAFAYPNPDLSSLEMNRNRKNIPKLKRQQKVVWPEFSWQTRPDEEDKKRCYQMFAPDISRLGYTAEGEVYSIICPQQGACANHLGCMNVEVTVTGNKGWADENTRELAAMMTVEGRIWFGPSAQENPIVKRIASHFNKHNLPFPSTKKNAIIVTTHDPGHPDLPEFPLRRGSSDDFPIPDFAKHEGISWTLGNLAVQIGPIKKTNVEKVDDFNQLVMNVFNMASGNMLGNKNILTWNVWFTAPELVDQKEWVKHTDYWRDSIDADQGSPEGPGTIARYYDGTPFQAVKNFFEEESRLVEKFLEKHGV